MGIVERHRKAVEAADALSALLCKAHPLAEGGRADWRRDLQPGEPGLGRMAADVGEWIGNLREACGRLNAEVARLEARGMRVKAGELTPEAFVRRMRSAGDCPFTDEALEWIRSAAAGEDFDPEAIAGRYSQLAAGEAAALGDGSVVCALARGAA